MFTKNQVWKDIAKNVDSLYFWLGLCGGKKAYMLSEFLPQRLPIIFVIKIKSLK